MMKIIYKISAFLFLAGIFLVFGGFDRSAFSADGVGSNTVIDDGPADEGNLPAKLMSRKISQRAASHSNYYEQFEKLRTSLGERDFTNFNPDQEREFSELLRAWFAHEPLEALRGINMVGKLNRKSALLAVGIPLLQDSELVGNAVLEGILEQSDLLMLAHRLEKFKSTQFDMSLLRLIQNPTFDETTKDSLHKIIVQRLKINPVSLADLKKISSVLPMNQQWEFITKVFESAPGSSQITPEEFLTLRDRCRNELELKSIVEAHCYASLRRISESTSQKPIDILRDQSLKKDDVRFALPVVAKVIASSEGWRNAVVSIRETESFSEQDHMEGLLKVVLDDANSSVGMQLLSGLDPEIPNLEKMISRAITHYLNEDVDHAVEWIDKMPAGKVRQISLKKVVQYLRRHGSEGEVVEWEALLETK